LLCGYRLDVSFPSHLFFLNRGRPYTFRLQGRPTLYGYALMRVAINVSKYVSDEKCGRARIVGPVDCRGVFIGSAIYARYPRRHDVNEIDWQTDQSSGCDATKE